MQPTYVASNMSHKVNFHTQIYMRRLIKKMMLPSSIAVLKSVKLSVYIYIYIYIYIMGNVIFNLLSATLSQCSHSYI